MHRNLAVGSVALGLLVSVVGSAVRRSHAPREASLDGVAAAVRGQWQDGDVLVLSPPWMHGMRRRLGDLPILDPEAISEPGLWRFRRVWAINEPALGAGPGPAARVSALGQPVASPPFSSGSWPITLGIVELSHGRRVAFDAYRQVGDLRVTAFYPDGMGASCDRWERDRWSCPRDAGWSYVGRQMFDIDGAGRACLWLHPLAAGGRLEVAFPPVSVGAAARLAGGCGFSANGSRSARAPVHLSVRDGERQVLDLEHPRSGNWRVLDVALPDVVVHELVITVTSVDNGAAHFCADLFVVEGER